MKNIKKKKVHKNIGGVLFFLSALSIFSVGFASWNINLESSSNVMMNIDVDDVMNANDFFTFQPIQMFEISKQGLVVDETIVYQGDIKIPFYVAIKNGIYPYLSENQLMLDIVLKNTGSFNLLSVDYMGSDAPTIHYSASTNYSANPETPHSTQGIIQSDSIQANVQFVDENLADVVLVYFMIVYHFDFSAYADTFETTIYNQIPDNGIRLNFQIGVDSI